MDMYTKEELENMIKLGIESGIDPEDFEGLKD